MYENGVGVPQDYKEAVSWYRKAAEQGFAGAQGNLGVMYGNGLGVPRDFVQSYMWLNLGASSIADAIARDQFTKCRFGKNLSRENQL
jgi:TPR repeat protein